MQTSQEIRNGLNNIRYYIKKLQELAKLQLEKDADVDLEMNTKAGTIRFDCLGAMHTAMGQIGIYCDNIEYNLKSAEKQGEKLRLPNEEEQKTEHAEEDIPF